MHHYRHHIGDFRSATMHLSDAEELAYRRMIELYYDTEEPLPASVEWIARRVRCTPEVVQRVLEDFFEQRTDGTWRQSRCDEELAEYRKVLRRNKANGKRGGRPSKEPATERQPTGNPVGFQPVAGGKPPNPQSPVPSTPLPVPQSPISVLEPPPRSGEGIASREAGIGERGGGDPRDREAMFALLCATPLRSKSKNRRQIFDEIAGALADEGMVPDQLRRLIAKARAESNGDYAALLDGWLKPGAWREKWAEIVSGRTGNVVARVAAARRAQ